MWRWKDWPDADGPTSGSTRRRAEGRALVAVQVKCYRPRPGPKREIDTFLSASSQERFAERLLIATCDLGRNARRTVEGQQKPVHTLLRCDLERSPVSWPRTRPGCSR